MINKILLLSVTISCCLHASTTERLQIGWKESVKAGLERDVTGSRQALLAELGIEEEFAQVDWHELAQQRIKMRDQRLAKTQTPLIDTAIPEDLIDVITRRFAKFNLDLDSLQIICTDHCIAAAMSGDYEIFINPKKLLQLPPEQICFTIDHEIQHWLNRHSLEGRAILNLCNFHSLPLEQHDEYLMLRRCQEKQADILAGLASLESANAAVKFLHDFMFDQIRGISNNVSEFDAACHKVMQSLDSMTSNEQCLKKSFCIRLGDTEVTIRSSSPDSFHNFVRWHYMKQLSDRMNSENKNKVQAIQLISDT